jgi:hypothetical protein
MTSERRPGGALLALLALAPLGAAACADFSRGPAEPLPEAGPPAVGEGGAGDGGGAVSFAADVYPLLDDKCARCHVAGGQASGSALVLTGSAAADYDEVKRLVDTGAPASSRLLSKASGNGHEGGVVYAAGSPEYETILLWIQQGAAP